MIELKAIYDSAKSFYGKAYIKERYINYYNEHGETTNTLKIKLYSYDTPVCTIYKYYNTNTICYILNYNIEDKLLLSRTTSRHIKEFLKQYFYNENIYMTKYSIVNNSGNEFKMK